MRDLMSKARELIRRRACGAAMVIVPLATSTSVMADSVFTYNDPNEFGNPSFISQSLLSGGGYAAGTYLGNIGGSTGTPDGSVHLSGNTQSVSGQPAFPSPGYLPAQLPLNNTVDALNNNNALPTVQFHWTGDIVNPNTPVYLTYSVPLQALTSNFGTYGSVTWALQAVVNDAADNHTAWADYSGTAFSNGTSETLTGTNILLTSSAPPLIFDPGGPASSWTVDLIVQWNLSNTTYNNGDAPTADHADEISVSPTIDLSAPFGAGGGINPVPLPPAVWQAGVLLSIMGLALSGKRLAARVTRKANGERI